MRSALPVEIRPSESWILIAIVGIISAIVSVAAAQRESSRSREVVARVAPTMRIDLAEKGLRLGDAVYLRLFKEERELEVWVRERDRSYVLFERLPICAWSGRLGPKFREGDMQSPEGFYRVGGSQLNPRSMFHLAFNLGFPNRFDRFHRRTGSALMIHGSCLSAGCYAMTDPVVERLWVLVDAALRRGVRSIPVHVFPFRMTDENMHARRDHEAAPFWRQLLPAFEMFERTSRLPRIRVVRGRYVVVPS